MIKKITFLFAIASALANVSNAQTIHYTEDFEGENIDSWTQHNIDADPYEWTHHDWGQENGILGNKTIYSLSGGYTQDGTYVELDPDNMITSPLFSLPSENPDQLVLRFNYFTATANPDIQSEKFSVYVSTENDSDAIVATTPLYTTIIEDSSINVAYVDLSAYAGQDVYVSFRHYECAGNYTLMIDNVTIQTQEQFDLAVAGLGLVKYSEQNVDNDLAFAVTNNGSEAITSYTLKWSDGEGVEYTETFTPETAIALGETTSTTEPEVFADKVNFSSLVNKSITVSVISVNDGETDANADNDEASTKFITVSEKPSKNVLFETMNGVWMEEADSPSSALDYMQDNHETFIGVAVHQAKDEAITDPFEVEAYTEGSGLLETGMHIDRINRNILSSQENMVERHDVLSDETVPASLSVETDGTADNLAIEITADFKATINDGDFRLGVIITEDEVDHDGNSYNHVARAILGTYDGMENSIAAEDIVDNQSASYTFNYSVPNGSDFTKMNAVAVLIDSEDGTILNSKKIALEPVLNVGENELADINLKMYPNPVSDELNISFSAEGNYTVLLTDMLGKVIYKKEIKNAFGAYNHTIPVSEYEQGNYILSVSNSKISFNRNIAIQ
ncbi:T9SS-dependent choice-of-anchor J family protein [Aureivirga marina]|uniref:T9SS-dependent choice-of-anchor J family protein n=1 Tax=Aureivirga marina TaxID=1182451 RepID=UPI0018CA0C2B|nr:choice-of-anchor J domain-containing protein [Aureivirga marina]